MARVRHHLFALFMISVMAFGVIVIGCSSSNKSSETSVTPPAKIGPKQYASAPPMMIDRSKSYTAIIHTNKGDITATLFAKEAPTTVNNFVFLSQEDYYNDVVFHRVIQGFMIQTGDPTGTGTGDPGYTFKDEPVTRNYETGTLAMANRGPDTNGSQFFICDADLSWLPKNYTIFGKVTQGIEVVHQIASAPVELQAGDQAPSKPTIDLHINSIEIFTEK